MDEGRKTHTHAGAGAGAGWATLTHSLTRSLHHWPRHGVGSVPLLLTVNDMISVVKEFVEKEREAGRFVYMALALDDMDPHPRRRPPPRSFMARLLCRRSSSPPSSRTPASVLVSSIERVASIRCPPSLERDLHSGEPGDGAHTAVARLIVILLATKINESKKTFFIDAMEWEDKHMRAMAATISEFFSTADISLKRRWDDSCSSSGDLDASRKSLSSFVDQFSDGVLLLRAVDDGHTPKLKREVEGREPEPVMSLLWDHAWTHAGTSLPPLECSLRMFFMPPRCDLLALAMVQLLLQCMSERDRRSRSPPAVLSSPIRAATTPARRAAAVVSSPAPFWSMTWFASKSEPDDRATRVSSTSTSSTLAKLLGMSSRSEAVSPLIDDHTPSTKSDTPVKAAAPVPESESEPEPESEPEAEPSFSHGSFTSPSTRTRSRSRSRSTSPAARIEYSTPARASLASLTKMLFSTPPPRPVVVAATVSVNKLAPGETFKQHQDRGGLLTWNLFQHQIKVDNGGRGITSTEAAKIYVSPLKSSNNDKLGFQTPQRNKHDGHTHNSSSSSSRYSEPPPSRPSVSSSSSSSSVAPSSAMAPSKKASTAAADRPSNRTSESLFSSLYGHDSGFRSSSPPPHRAAPSPAAAPSYGSSSYQSPPSSQPVQTAAAAPSPRSPEQPYTPQKIKCGANTAGGTPCNSWALKGSNTCRFH